MLVFLLMLAVLGDFGLREWFEDEHFDRLALHLWPLALAYAALGAVTERTGRRWFVPPLYGAAALVLVAVLDLLALDGRTFQYLGLSMQPYQTATVKDPTLLDTLAALTLNGLVFYLFASLVDRYGSELMKVPAAWLLFTISPFSSLEPLGYLSETAEYSRKFDWLYLAIAIALLSHVRQRKSFYYAGLLNTGIALVFIAQHQKWLDKPLWAMALIGSGLIALAAGFVLDARHRFRVS